MLKPKDIGSDLKLSDRATLDLLVVLEEADSVNQRSLAKRLGVALGLTNTLLKRAIRKGLVKVAQAPARRYAYYVTPKGFGEKSRLVADYLTSSLDFFRIARTEYADIFAAVPAQGGGKVYLHGIGDLAEIAVLSAQGAGVELAGVISRGSNVKEFHGLEVLQGLPEIEDAQGSVVVITDSEKPQDAYDDAVDALSADRVFAAEFLHVSVKKRGAK